MKNDYELLPLPKYPVDGAVDEYSYNTGWNDCLAECHACVARVTAAKDDEVEKLRAEVTEWKRVASAQAELHGEAEARAEQLAEALQGAWKALWLVLWKTGTVTIPLYDIATTDWSRCQVEQTEDELTWALRFRATVLVAKPVGSDNDR